MGRRDAIGARRATSAPPKRGVEFRFQEVLDEAANASAHPGFRRIEPIIRFGCFRWRFRGIRSHGGISVGQLTPILFVETTLVFHS
jgi:hypothetical protein